VPGLFYFTYIVNSKTRVAAIREKFILEKGFHRRKGLKSSTINKKKGRKEGKRNK
jgi:hypothetical protein